MSLKYAIQLGTILFCMSACGQNMTSTTDSSGGSNNGSAPDATPQMDASVFADAIPAMDVAEPLDAGLVLDAGVSMDTGPADSGPADTGPADTGVAPGTLKVQPLTTSVAMTWVYSGPASLYFTQTEVTVAQYEACVNAGSCTSPNYDMSPIQDCNYGDASRSDHPMNCVNWYGAGEFCAWVGGRLPDENEWYAEASNGGTRLYPWGDTPQASCTHCVMDWGCGNGSTMPVGSKPLGDSVSGVSDLSGNVWEWTATPFASSRYMRGGSWINANSFDAPLASARLYYYPGLRYYFAGIRCVSLYAP